jgi:hypothetical protein
MTSRLERSAKRPVWLVLSACCVSLLLAVLMPTVQAANAAATTKKKLPTSATTKKRPKRPGKPTTTRRRKPVGRPTTVVPTVAPTVALTTLAPTVPPTVAAVPPTALDPNATTLPGAIPVASVSTTKPLPTTSTTLVPAAYPAPANPPTRPSAATLDAYRGVGMWIDRYDWTTKWSGKAVPPVNVATMDTIANLGVQTIYIQAAHWAFPGTNDILEPEKLIPIIDRAHQLGMYVVVWYLPVWQDVNTDLRKTVAIANLDVDGVNIDIEDRDGVRNITERTKRLIAYSAAVRQLLPGRLVTNNIYATNYLDGAPDFWPQANGQPKANVKWWGGAFPYADLAPYYDMWMIQDYWTDRATDSGWKDGYRYSMDNMARLRGNIGRADVPIQLIGGVGTKAGMTLNEVSGFLQAARESGSTGVSFYDWVTFTQSWAPYFWQLRSGPVDPRFIPVAVPPYVAQPKPVPTIPPTTAPVVGTTVPVIPTTPPAPPA